MSIDYGMGDDGRMIGADGQVMRRIGVRSVRYSGPTSFWAHFQATKSPAGNRYKTAMGEFEYVDLGGACFDVERRRAYIDSLPRRP